MNNLTKDNRAAKVIRILNKYNTNQRRKLVSLKIDGCSLLFQASSVGNVNLVNYFLDFCSANPEQKGGASYMKCTPLVVAASRNHLQVVITLVEHGADVNAQCSRGRSAISVACRFPKIIEYLVQQGAEVDSADWKGRTCLMYSIQNLNTCIYLLSIGADVNKQDKRGSTALFYAIRKGVLRIVDIFVRHGALLLYIDQNGNTPIDVAALHCKTEILEYLIATNRYPLMHIARAYEIIGSCFVTDFHQTHSLLTAKRYWMKALQIRNKCGINHKYIPSYLIPIINILGSEFNSVKDLNSLPLNSWFMWTQALIIQFRILGPTHPTTRKSFIDKAFVHINQREFKSAMDLTVCLLSGTRIYTDPIQEDVIDVIKSFSTAISEASFDAGLRSYYLMNVFRFLIRHVLYNVVSFVDELEYKKRGLKLASVERYLLLILNQLRTVLSLSLTEDQITDLRKSLYWLISNKPRGVNETTLLHLSIQTYQPVTVVETLLNCGEDVNARDNQGNTAMHYAIQYASIQQIENMKSLISRGFHVDAANEYGGSCLEYLTLCGLVRFPMQYISLQCLAAKVIKRQNLPYAKILAKDLERFVDCHG